MKDEVQAVGAGGISEAGDSAVVWVVRQPLRLRLAKSASHGDGSIGINFIVPEESDAKRVFEPVTHVDGLVFGHPLEVGLGRAIGDHGEPELP